LSKLLGTLHPEYPWDESQFEAGESHPPGYWKDVRNQRACLDTFAAEVGISKVSALSILILLNPVFSLPIGTP